MDADWRPEVTAPTRDLERLVGHRVRLFAYPYGLHDRAAFPHLRRALLRRVPARGPAGPA